MSKPKTVPTASDVGDYLAGIADDGRRRDAAALCDLMRSATGEPPVMWGPSIVGFGRYHYRYESGREGDSLRVGFSARKQAPAVYGIDPEDPATEQLGKHKTGKGCLYVKTPADVDTRVLSDLVRDAYARMA
ncbi:protein of unknown function (DU1801) [Actinopolymorpha cephalotaxi]|uniref:YdhG-like domain-containing protein n=1 Tax=Actinopolymorpha cephalotaxi TaxID=504797 RepID=A0A1I2NMD3_9ACTN|nr:DUF1801 domain-containing protein [Actinopolymorpha cephalotaxi]NYH85483.1 hypothetical protein [Actinopolymorpha cephalotaxi]SFG03929.1 protein of unknown function (DU1801) [Actinopolymorpha cephalotaxi]